jgi:hypothetical protein
LSSSRSSPPCSLATAAARLNPSPDPGFERRWSRRTKGSTALAWYFDHVQEIQEEMRADRAYAEEFRRDHPSVLDAKLSQEPVKEAS